MKDKTDSELFKLGEEIGMNDTEAWDGYSGIELFAYAFRLGYLARIKEEQSQNESH